MIGKSETAPVEPSDEPLVIEIDDETFAVLKLMAGGRGISVGDLAGELLNEAVFKDATKPVERADT